MLRPSDAWLRLAMGDAGISTPSMLSSYPFETVRSVVQLAGYASLFVVAANIRHEAAKRWLLVGVVAVGLWQVADGAAQYFAGRVIEGETAALAHGSFVSRNHFSAFLEGAVGAALAITAGGGWLAGIMVALFAGIALSYSRAGIAVVGVALIFLGLRHKKPWLAWALAIFVLAAGLGLYGYSDRFSAMGDDLRTSLWSDGAAALVENPWIGSGLGTFPYVFARSEMYLPRKTIEHAHNDYLEFAVELGLPATLLGLALVGVAIRRAYVSNFGCFLGAASILTHGLVDSPLHAPAVAALAAVATEMTRRYGRVRGGRRLREGVPAGHWRTLSVLGAIRRSGSAGAGLFCWGWVGRARLWARRSSARSFRQLSRSAALAAVLLGLGWSGKIMGASKFGALIPAALAITALLFAGGAFSTWDANSHHAKYQRALIAGDDQAATLSLRRALESNPRSAVLWLEAAFLSERQGFTAQGRRRLAVARRLEPFTLRTEWAWAEFHRRNGDPVEAEQTFARLVVNMPEMAAAAGR